ncbi:MAG: dihydrodipicolinate synthase family protein [Acidobacteria bacterium]|nr:dihydrodipicolinate synthase family protein [Acidobacteriota bacterium]
MNRREFSKTIAAGAIAATVPGALYASSAVSRPEQERVDRSARKEWAREHFKGFENIFMASHKPDFSGWDEEGIRHDVRQAESHGFFSTFVVGGENPAESRRLMEIVTDEAKGKILVSTGGFGRTPAAALEWLQFCERLGVSHALVGLPPDTDSEDAMYRHVAQIAEGTNLGLVLYAVDGAQYRKFHPSNIPFEVFNRLADLPNVVAMKVMTTLDTAATFDLYEKMGTRILIGTVDLVKAPLLIKHCGMQWSGAWTVEALQSPEKPYATDFIKLMMAGQTEKAMKIYWHIAPATQALFDLMRPILPMGIHPWAHLKYYQWCTGGNGGLMKYQFKNPEIDQHYILRRDQRELIRNAYNAIGITPPANDDEFIVGKAAYARGVRPADLPQNPLFG